VCAECLHLTASDRWSSGLKAGIHPSRPSAEVVARGSYGSRADENPDRPGRTQYRSTSHS
jgi:hypothetical protein